MLQKKIQTATCAAWRVILIQLIILVVQYVGYLIVMCRQPTWFASVWGSGITWSQIQMVWLVAMVVFKVGFWFSILATLFLTFWARQLKKQGVE